MKSSRIPGFFKLTPEERRKVVAAFASLDEKSLLAVSETGLTVDQANHMIENVIGTVELPLGIAVNFRINKKDYLIPMASEEPSVVAAATNAAKMTWSKGGFTATTTGSIMIGQVQIIKINDPENAKKQILKHKNEIIKLANEQDPFLVKLGGGARDVEVRIIDTPVGVMVILHLLVDTKDAMGANTVDTMAEAIAPFLEEITQGKVNLRIISNLADRRLARAEAIFDKDELGGKDVVDNIINAYYFAAADPYRAATHNKGIMNGINAIVQATLNDTRAVAAGAHAYAARSGHYTSLTNWSKTPEGDLRGSIELPIAVGIVGGATKTHPVAQAVLKILGVKTASELSEVIACVGLAQNLGALRALAAEGIQRGHMKLHARNIAITAGAAGDLIDKVAQQLINEKKIRVDRAKELIDEYTD
jgi:hydroxymethylglutaryl-CoA reductase